MEARNHNQRGTLVGLVLVAVGVLALLSQLGVFSGIRDWLGALVFAAIGAFILRRYRTRGRVGALIAGFTLFGLAAASIGGTLSGFLFLGFVGAGFLAVYLVEPRRWWGVIAAGTLFSLAVVAGIDELAPGYDAGWVLFLGLAVTFVVLYRLPGDPKGWAIFPAVGSLVLAALGLSIGGTWLVPVALVALGVFLLLRREDVLGGRGGSAVPSGGGGRGDSGAVGGTAGTEGEAGAGGAAGTDGDSGAGGTAAEASGPGHEGEGSGPRLGDGEDKGDEKG